jgi:5-methyltetrahydropteroyltriglutamate--homocysteine methyltransferase
MAIATNLGYPRLGPQRELKWALEKYWAGKIDVEELQRTARGLRLEQRRLQQQLGITHIPSNDFSLYDHVLDTIAMVGAVPERYGWQGDTVDLATYFAMARGVQGERPTADGGTETVDIPAMEMTKWFDTNYHYIVPEFAPDQTFRLAATQPLDAFEEGRAQGIPTRPVLLGPVSFLLLGKPTVPDFNPLTLLDRLLPVYADVLRRLSAAGAEWVQIDEPCLVFDLEPAAQQAFQTAYTQLAEAAPDLKLLLATYFGDLRDNLSTALQLPIAALHLDLVRAPAQLTEALEQVPQCMALSLGVVDGRNIWKTDLQQALALVQQAVAALGSERLLIGPSCSLLHTPYDLALETDLDADIRDWLAFARQKLTELVTLTRAANDGPAAVASDLATNQAAMERRRSSSRIHNPAVKQRAATAINDPALTQRQQPFAARRDLQKQHLTLPPFPTTTIGSFPQTKELRQARAQFRKGKLTAAEYEAFLKQATADAIRIQEEVGLDVLVHGEFERNDMVEYFGEQLTGYVATRHGWVQSYGSRGVKPPIIYGDVARAQPMTVAWAQYAQSLTDCPMKGMLTGPVTIVQWSFVRDDQPRADTCRQIALAIRDEVQDLEAAGIHVIQIDEPAFREGLPLRRADWGAYLNWAVECFRLATSGVRDETQIHTHMCYSEFNDIIGVIAALDADVISIETSRSRMELLDAFVTHQYPNDIGPGVYDVHSPRIPSHAEMEALLLRAVEVLRPEQIWVNPDCGLKTRRWEEVTPALREMVAAAQQLRASVAVPG